MKTIDDLIATLNEHHEFNTIAHTANVLQNQENDSNLETINKSLQDIKTDLNSFFKVQQKQYDDQRVINLENKREAERAAEADSDKKFGQGGSVIDTSKPEEGFFGGKFGFLALATGLTAAVSGYIVGLTTAIAKGFTTVLEIVTSRFAGIGQLLTKNFSGITSTISNLATNISNALKPGFAAVNSLATNISKFVKAASLASVLFVQSTKSFDVVVDFISKAKSFFMPLKELGTVFSLGGQASGGSKLFQGLLKTLGSIGGYFDQIFKVFSKVAVPLTVIIASIKAIYESVTEATGFFDGVFSLIKNLFKELVSAFITFPMELIKDIISWIAGALGFDAIESALDSFDIDAIFRDIVDGIYDGIKGVLSWMGSMLNPLNWFGKDTQDDIDSETARLESDVQDARADAADLSNAYAVSEDGSYTSTVVLSSNTDEQNKALSEQEIVSKGMRVATPEQRQRMQQAADDRVAQAEAALKEHQDVSSVVSAVQPMNIFKHIGNLFGGGEEEQTDTSKYDRAKARADRAFDTSGDPFAPKVSREDRERALSQRNELRDRMDYFTPTIGPLQKGVGDVVSRGQDIFAAAASGAMDFGGRALGTAKDFGGQAGQALDAAGRFGGQAIDAAGEFGGQAIDAAGEAFDTVSETVGGATADAISAVKDKASQLFDPIKNAFNSMIDTVKGIFDFSKIKMMLTNMFAEIGVPRVEFDVPVIGKIGFGPFYPFAPDAGSFQQNHNRSLETESEGSTLKTRDSSIAAVGAYADSEAEYGMTYDSSASTTLQETKRDGDLETTRNTNVFAGFDYETGTGKVSLESTDFLDNIATDEYKEIKNAAEEYNVGPIAFGKVRRMIDAGASAQDIRDFLKENEVTVSDKITQFLSPFTDKAKDLAGQAKDAITGAGSTAADIASTVGFGAMDQVDALSDFAGGAFKKAQAAMIDDPYANLDEETQDKLGALRSSLRMIRGEEDAAGNITTDAQLEGTIEKGEGFLKAERDLEQQIADLSGMSLEDSRAAEKLVAEKNFLLGGDLSSQGVEDFDFGDIDNSSVEPIASRSLSAPVGQASQEIAAEQSSATVNAPVTNANVNNSSQVNNVYNSKTIAPPPQARSSDPTFQRMQNANFSGQ